VQCELFLTALNRNILLAYINRQLSHIMYCTSCSRDELAKMTQKMFFDGGPRLQLAAEARKNSGTSLRHQRTGVRKVLRQFVGSRFGEQRHELSVVQSPDLVQLHELLSTTTSLHPHSSSLRNQTTNNLSSGCPLFFNTDFP